MKEVSVKLDEKVKDTAERELYEEINSIKELKSKELIKKIQIYINISGL